MAGTFARVISVDAPRDGRNWDCQCARCGSSTYSVDCDNCAGEGWIEDDDWQADEGDGWTCDWCQGSGGYQVCCSSADWCEAHPNVGREDVKRGAIEWFTFDAPKIAP
jgi:hypothetical protein